MLQYATGFLEVNNLASAIEAADQMLKSANLESIEKINLGDSVITLIIKGDAPSVEAALITGESSAKKNGSFICSHSIPDLNPQIEKSILNEVK